MKAVMAVRRAGEGGETAAAVRRRGEGRTVSVVSELRLSWGLVTPCFAALEAVRQERRQVLCAGVGHRPEGQMALLVPLYFQGCYFNGPSTS